jgi:hypothetical protein
MLAGELPSSKEERWLARCSPYHTSQPQEHPTPRNKAQRKKLAPDTEVPENQKLFHLLLDSRCPMCRTSLTTHQQMLALWASVLLTPAAAHPPECACPPLPTIVMCRSPQAGAINGIHEYSLANPGSQVTDSGFHTEPCRAGTVAWYQDRISKIS